MTGVGVGVGATTPPYSYAPMSKGKTLVAPEKSVVKTDERSAPALMAGELVFKCKSNVDGLTQIFVASTSTKVQPVCASLQRLFKKVVPTVPSSTIEVYPT